MRCVPGITTAFREASILNRENPLIIKGEDSEIEIFTGTDVYFASKKLGQISIKWNDFENNE